MPASPAASLFASDYSLSPVPSLSRSYPNSPNASNTTTPSPGLGAQVRNQSPRPTRLASAVAPDQYHSNDIPLRNLDERKYSIVDSLPVPTSRHSPAPGSKKLPMPVVFPTDSNYNMSVRPGSGGTSTPNNSYNAGVPHDPYTAPPQKLLRKQSSSMLAGYKGGNYQELDGKGSPEDKGSPNVEDELSTVPILESGDGGRHTGHKTSEASKTNRFSKISAASKASSGVGAKSKLGYHDCESCMQGGLGHETKSASYKVGNEKAYHHLQRANELFGQALAYKPGYPKGMLAKAKILIQLAMHYQPPKVATVSLREAVGILRQLTSVAARSVSARETLAQACALLSGILLETDDTVDDESKIWEGEIGKLAREALQNLEDVAADRMDKMRTMDQRSAAEQAPSMAEMFLALSSAAITVSTLSMDLPTVDIHIELAEQALDQASNMATVAASARVKSSTSSANLITRVQIASGRSSMERLRHTFLLGSDLDEDDFRSLMADMSMLATECRERAAKLKGGRGASASTLAWEAIKQLGDGKVLYASLLRLVWRKRHPKRRAGGSNGEGPRKLSQRTSSMESTIHEEDEEEGGDTLEVPTRPGPWAARQGSHLDSVSEEADPAAQATRGVDYFTAGPAASDAVHAITTGPNSLANLAINTNIPFPIASTPSSAGSGRRGSWLPDSFSRSRRQSSMTSPLTGPEGISAWNRKASVISLKTEEDAKGVISSAELAQSAWQLLESAIKQYKLALTLLSSSDLPPAQLARAKAETLAQIAHASHFQASLSTRVAAAAEKKTSLLVTAEVYATWAAREVGWSFLIEGTQESALADRRTNSWRADEAGKRAVMLLVRVWWFRAVTTETIDIDTKTQAKDAVEVVVRRMRDREGVRDGDVNRWKMWVGKSEGEMDPAEILFWRSVSRILRGGAGFVMS